jgi:diguanylate cyclase (GGDEF)-like protein
MFQIVLFFLTAVYTLLRSSRTKDNAKRRRYNTIGSFGIVMVILLSMEMLFPIMPLYTAGYMLGICMMHTFVIEDELSDYIVNLEELLEREKQQTQQIISAKKLAHTDPLTGIKNKLAYIEKEKDLDARIENGEVSRMAIAVFDLNGLKEINDTKGHEVGDKYIVDGCKMICNHFKHSPVFRIGGDEFVAVLEGDDFKNRNRIMKAFNNLVMENSMNGGVVVSAGIAEYLPENDAGTKTIFDRADHYMYEHKRLLKLQDAG